MREYAASSSISTARSSTPIDLIIFCFHETLHVLDLPPRSDEQILSEIGRPLHLQARDIDADRAEEIFSLYQGLYEKHRERLMREFPGIREVLEALLEGGYRVGVVTSKRSSSAGTDIKHLDLEHIFEVVITADYTQRHKPDPEPVLEALQRMGASREEATYIGDSPYDLRCAHAAGVPAGAVEWGPFPRESLLAEKPDYWISQPSELLTLFPGVSPTHST